jgi:uncharacterized protein (DUF302 family)/uncharacterized membrane protein YidH (DUF202 family)
MDGSAGEAKPSADLRDYLAAEQTLLAWIRTGLALMGFGFVVARFGLFLEQLHAADQALSAESYGVSLCFGTALIAAGVAVNVFSAYRYARLVRRLDRGQWAYPRPSVQAIATALFLALVGLAMAIYLISVRTSARPQLGNLEEQRPMTATTSSGIVDIASNHSVEQTVGRLKDILQAKGLTLFALVDHSGEAAKVGLQMPSTKLLIFGSPKGGTPVMIAAPTISLDLPLKALVWEDSGGKVWVSYNSPEYLKQRHNIPDALVKNISGVAAIVEEASVK